MIFQKKYEEKNLFEYLPSEHVQPNDIEWYDKFYKTDYDYSKLYEIDPLDDWKTTNGRKLTLDILQHKYKHFLYEL